MKIQAKLSAPRISKSFENAIPRFQPAIIYELPIIYSFIILNSFTINNLFELIYDPQHGGFLISRRRVNRTNLCNQTKSQDENSSKLVMHFLLSFNRSTLVSFCSWTLILAGFFCYLLAFIGFRARYGRYENKTKVRKFDTRDLQNVSMKDSVH